MIKRKTFKISLLGESSVGKTSIYQFHEDKTFVDAKEKTIGIVESFKYVKFPGDNEEYKFKIFDTAGQERYRSITNTTIQLADGFLMVFAVDNKKSFERINDWIKFIDEHVDLKEKVLYLVGNKIDIKEREVEKEEGEEFAKKMGIKYRETSAKTGEGTEEVFQEIYKDVYEKNKQNFEKNNNQTIKLDKKRHTKKEINKFLKCFKKYC